MADQRIDYEVPGVDTDTGTTLDTAIRGIENGEPLHAEYLNRGPQNLRTRTEVVRDRLEELLYLRDADRELVLHGGGTLTWNATTGVFTTTAEMHLQPMLSPTANTSSQVSVGTAPSEVVLTAAVRAYAGGNAWSVKITDALALAHTVDAPHHRLEVTIQSGVTTVTQLVNYLNAALGAYNITAAIGPTSGGAEFAPLQTERAYFTGAADLEIHTITVSGFSNFFSTRTLTDGDTLCIGYDEHVTNIGNGGRRQSSGAHANVDGNLFLLSEEPEKLPEALPICRRIGAHLVFLGGRALRSGAADTLLNLVPITATGSVAENLVPVSASAQLGATNAPWQDVYLENIHILGGTVDGEIIPETTGTQLGVDLLRWDAFVRDLNVSGKTTGNLVPAGATQALGSTTDRWRDVYTAFLQFPVPPSAGGYVTGHILPDDALLNLGSAAAPWETGHINQIHSTNVLPVAATGQALGSSAKQWDAFVRNITIGSTGRVTGNVVPDTAASRSLGSETNRWTVHAVDVQTANRALSALHHPVVVSNTPEPGADGVASCLILVSARLWVSTSYAQSPWARVTAFTTTTPAALPTLSSPDVQAVKGYHGGSHDILMQAGESNLEIRLTGIADTYYRVVVSLMDGVSLNIEALTGNG